MALSDRIVGGGMLFVAAFVFSYYTLWAFLTPFLATDSSLHSFFPSRVWAVRLPALVLVLGLGLVGAFVGKVMMAEEKKKREKAQRVKQG
ncbi:hypothetical protein BCV69DRAFT_282530 [Microstroma glucosiphilum]|uniref:Dolichol phosphate-mannose biosynthesis regulatory protein n=1 Tax=Pseudomicrostroma glucosiphilum TaxID=1684307 RepID=A0A316U6Y9_9BASI|nr:hypothetical protein BCV69DRAFT_282530 [Pseudomicrostroma glucosiphilum]PWN21026.1 hypothetical protein BCV69DRAFT_282530 [Pseudomicrostroma glucosiphilum]